MVPERGDITTSRAVFRNHRIEAAIAETRRSIVCGWTTDVRVASNVVRARFNTPDEKWARKFGLRIATEDKQPTRTRSARTVHSLVIPPFLNPANDTARAPLFAALHHDVDCSGADQETWNLPPDPVIETKLKNGRIVWVNSFPSRVLQRAVLSAVAERAELSMCDGSHGYRVGRSRFTALKSAAQLTKQYPFAVELDIVGFFKSVTPALAEAAIARNLPWIHWTLRRLILWLLTPPVILRPSHPEWRPPSPADEYRYLKGLPEGGLLPPFASNVVADTIIGWPFEDNLTSEGRAALVRYSDNMMVVGRTAADVMEGVDLIEAALGKYGLHLHPVREPPRDVRVQGIDWLGKRIHGGSVRTPEKEVRRYVRLLKETNAATFDFRQTVGWVLTELSLDGAARVEFLARLLRGASRSQFEAFQMLRGARLRSAPDPEPDDIESLEAAQAAKEDI